MNPGHEMFQKSKHLLSHGFGETTSVSEILLVLVEIALRCFHVLHNPFITIASNHNYVLFNFDVH